MFYFACDRSLIHNKYTSNAAFSP